MFAAFGAGPTMAGARPQRAPCRSGTMRVRLALPLAAPGRGLAHLGVACCSAPVLRKATTFGTVVNKPTPRPPTRYMAGGLACCPRLCARIPLYLFTSHPPALAIALHSYPFGLRFSLLNNFTLSGVQLSLFRSIYLESLAVFTTYHIRFP
jgi:hypothetical protein